MRATGDQFPEGPSRLVTGYMFRLQSNGVSGNHVVNHHSGGLEYDPVHHQTQPLLLRLERRLLEGAAAAGALWWPSMSASPDKFVGAASRLLRFLLQISGFS